MSRRQTQSSKAPCYPIKKYQFLAFQQMYPMDSDVSLYNLHTICYSSQLKEPLIHGDEDTRRHSILHALLFVVLWTCPWLPLLRISSKMPVIY